MKYLLPESEMWVRTNDPYPYWEHEEPDYPAVDWDFRKAEDYATWQNSRESYARTGSIFWLTEMLSHIRADEERYDLGSKIPFSRNKGIR